MVQYLEELYEEIYPICDHINKYKLSDTKDYKTRREFLQMNKIITALTSLSLLTGAAGVPKYSLKEIYPKTMQVTYINSRSDTMTLLDGNDFSWDIKGVEDWVVGDICSCIMYNNNTEEIFDDVILDVKYSGNTQAKAKTLVTQIHEDDQITILTKYNGRVKERKIHGYDFEIPILLAEEIPTQKAHGKFTNTFLDVDGKTYYQFKSRDDSVWWVLTKEEIGFIPSLEEEYVLLYCNNGTTSENKHCDCLTKWDCECEVYDDVFFGIF